jgi:hypothetical protein
MADHLFRAAGAGIFLVVVGIGVGVFGIEQDRRERAVFEGWLQAQGTVTDVFNGSQGPRPLVVFTTESGTRVNFTMRPSLVARRIHTGDTVHLFYPSFDPRLAIVDSPRLRYFRNGALGAGALFLIAFGGYMAWYTRRRMLTAE